MKVTKNGKKLIHIKGEDFEIIIAVRKPTSPVKILKEVWVKCPAKRLKTHTP